jgi:hypothetical protein
MEMKKQEQESADQSIDRLIGLVDLEGVESVKNSLRLRGETRRAGGSRGFGEKRKRMGGGGGRRDSRENLGVWARAFSLPLETSPGAHYPI